MVGTILEALSGNQLKDLLVSTCAINWTERRRVRN